MRESGEPIGAFDRTVRGIDKPLEELPCPLDIPSGDVQVGGDAEPATVPDVIGLRGEVGCALGERCRGIRRAASRHRGTRLVQRRRDVVVRLGHRACQVASALLWVGRDLGQATVDLPATRLGRARVGRGRKEGMGEDGSCSPPAG